MTEEFTNDILQTLKQLMQRFDVSAQIKPQDEFVVHNQTTLKIIHDTVSQLEALDAQTTPYYEQLTMMAGALLSSAGETASAETLFSKARNLAKDDAKKALACYNLFQVLVRCHSYAKALDALQTAIKLDPSCALHDVHKYPIERLLGAGGMGCVFLCHDEWRENKVVVKCFWEGRKGSREEVFKEVLVMRQLESPYVLKTISFGYADAIRQERPYFVTEYIEEALDAEAWLTQHGQLSLEMGLEVGLQVAEGLAMAHQVGVCHLDLKPSNLLFKQEGEGIQVKIIDFGLARVATSLRNLALVTQVRSGKSMLTRAIFGTLGYAPPEQQGETQYGKPGAKSDIFAFGATMYRLLTGENPRFPHPRKLPDVPELQTLLLDCLEAHPDKRPEINGVVEQLKRLLKALKPPVVESITIDSTPLLSHNGTIWKQKYDPNQLVGNFLDRIYSLIADHVEPCTYGSAWVLRDAQSGQVFYDLKGWRVENSMWRSDTRSLSEVGILAGCKLEIIRPAFFEINSNGDLIEVTETTVEIIRDTLQDGTKGPEMVVIPAGTFRMGDVQGTGYPNEQPVHEVSVESFAMGRYPVTFEEYDKYAEAMGRKKLEDMGWGRGRRPVISVSWYDALAYAEWLNQQTGEHYYLPTEAEWEYAAKAGTETDYWWGNNITEKEANYFAQVDWLNPKNAEQNHSSADVNWKEEEHPNYGEEEEMTTVVGSYAPNPFGLYDTVGNVWEWTGSEYEERYNGKELRCADKGKESLRTRRGGAWYYEAKDVRAAYRDGQKPSYWSLGGGFRLARKINLTTPNPSLSRRGTEHTTSPLLTKEGPGVVEEPLTAFRDRLHDTSEGPEMVVIPAGQFKMGDIQGTGRKNEQPVHEVFVESFAIGRCPVTFEEYDKYAEATGREKPDDMGWGRRNRPVISVGGLDALAYTQWLSEQTGYTYRLPTEAEWEYAARAGTETDYWWGNAVDKGCANYGSGQFQTHDDMTKIVGSYASNPFGLYDTLGNVWEWTCSEYAECYDGKEQQQYTPITSNTRLVRRGGCWCDDAKEIRVAYRCEKLAGSGNAGIGFRLVRELSTPQTRAKQIRARKFSKAFDKIKTKIQTVQGDITEQHVDAIVNPTDMFFSGGGGADYTIHLRAGRELLDKACKALEVCDPGQARITKGFNLPAKFIIHTVGPVWKGGNDKESQILAQCYRNSLALAKEHGLKTIAFPAISTGAFGFPKDLASMIAMREITQFLSENPEFEAVILVDYD